jgi:pyruvate,water dikinase
MIDFVPPGKGEWRSLSDHFPRPLTFEYQSLIKGGMETGDAEMFERYGLPAHGIRPAFVHGYLYIGVAPLVGKAANRLPPKPLLWLAARLVPAFRRRNAAARRTLAERPWLDEVARWHDVERPACEAANAALDAVDVASLDDVALAEHLLAVRANADAGYHLHFRLHGADLFPTALLLLRAREWGIDEAEVLSLLAGASPASTGSGSLPAWRLVTGYDVDSLAACELPPLARRDEPKPLDAPDPSSVRARIPADERDELDVLLADARATYGLRDDNGMLTGAWPVGLLRRAMLEAGKRLGFGALAIEATSDELAALLRGGNGPAADELASRAQAREQASASPAPPSLGPSVDLPTAALPKPMRRMTEALLAIRDLGTTALDGRQPLCGVGVGVGTGVGTACVATDPNEALARFEPGSILVAIGTTPAFNALLAVAAGVVTEEGGILSHAAVMARELGIPAVIGAQGALSAIPDGALVEVDAVAGQVRVLVPD